MSGTKASNQQRTSKKAADFILRQKTHAGGAYAQGWNHACEMLAAQISGGAHLQAAPAVAKTSTAAATPAVKTVLQPAQDGSVAPAPRCGVEGCIHQEGHVGLGQPLHSDGKHTWRDRK